MLVVKKDEYEPHEFVLASPYAGAPEDRCELGRIASLCLDTPFGQAYLVDFFGRSVLIKTRWILGVPRFLAYIEGGILHEVIAPKAFAGLLFTAADNDNAKDGDGDAQESVRIFGLEHEGAATLF